MNPMDQQTAAVTGPAEGLGIALPFEEFFEAERGRLFRALLLITHDSTDAEDLMQEAFVRVWERWDRVGTLDDPVGYLFKTALNLRRSALRHLDHAMRHVIESAWSLIDEADWDEPEDNFDAIEILAEEEVIPGRLGASLVGLAEYAAEHGEEEGGWEAGAEDAGAFERVTEGVDAIAEYLEFVHHFMQEWEA